MDLEELTKVVVRLRDELEMLKKQVEEQKVTGNDAQSKPESPRPLETESSLLEKAKQRCVALYRNDKYVALAFYMVSMPSYLVTAGEPFHDDAYGDTKVKIWRFGFDEKLSIEALGYPETNIALLEAHEVKVSQFVKQGGYGSEGYQPPWYDSGILYDGTRATIFGFDGMDLVPKSGEVVEERPVGKYAIISCSLGPAAIGSPVVDGEGVVLGMVIEDLGETARLLTTGGILDWMRMRRRVGLCGHNKIERSGHSGEGWRTTDAKFRNRVTRVLY